MKSGILLVAHGKAAYWDEAVTLARSIRRFSPNLSIAVASDLDVCEASWRRDGFDAYVPYNFRKCGGVSFKMQLDLISPYPDATLFIDTDSICYADISSVFDAFAEDDFVALGGSLHECDWFEDSSLIRQIFGIQSFPFFCGDFYMFRRTARTQSVFAMARDVVHRYREVGIRPLGGWCNDEPVFALAMACHNIQAKEGVGEWIVGMQVQNLRSVVLDYSRGRAVGMLQNRRINPRLVHFQAHRSQPTYYRQRFLVRHADGWWNRVVASRIVGLAESLSHRGRRWLASR
jgi:hypothetical protein